LNSSVSFHHSSLDCALILHFPYSNPTSILLYLVAPPQLWPASSFVSTSSWFSTKDFLCRVTFVHPNNMSSPSTSTKFNKFHIKFITDLIYFKVFAPPPKSIFKYLVKYFSYTKHILTVFTHRPSLGAKCDYWPN
jgi:hypothetical protein